MREHIYTDRRPLTAFSVVSISDIPGLFVLFSSGGAFLRRSPLDGVNAVPFPSDASCGQKRVGADRVLWWSPSANNALSPPLNGIILLNRR